MWRGQRTAIRRTRTELHETRGQLREARTRERVASEALSKRQADFEAERTRMQTELQGAQGRAAEADADLARLRGALGADEGEVGTDEGGRITLALVDRVLFRSGDAQLTPGGIRVLSRVGEALRAIPDRQVWVQGHTDDQPIRSEQFASNWELSTARAVSVVHYLQDEAHIPPRRLAAVGFSQYHPIAKNRAKNRRIEIVLFPSQVRLVGTRPAAATAAPAKAP
jgi:chemotaxis protein MotB